MAATKNFVIEENATFRKTVYYMDQAQRPHDLTGFTADLTIKDTIGGTILMQLAVGSGITLIGSGGIRIEIADTSSTAITWTDAVYQMHLTAPSGDVLRLLEGTFTFSPVI